MRVALVLYGDLDFVSGGFLYDRMLVEYLRRQGEVVEIISLPWRSYPRGLLDNLSLTLKRRLESLRADIVLQDELAHPSLFRLNRRIKEAPPGPVVSLVLHLRSCEIHPPWKQHLYRWVEQTYLRYVDGFIYTSHAIRREVENLAGAGRPWVVAYPGGDHLPFSTTIDDITQRVLKPGPLEIVSVANLIPRKGLHTLLDALASLPPGNPWRLRVAGSLTDNPSYVRSIRQKVLALGLEGQVILLGLLSAEEISALLNQSHIIAVPAFYEALGIVFLEAMRAGLPAIASTAGGAQEIITNGQEGFLVPPGDVPALVNSLHFLLSDRQRLLDMSLRAWERSRTHPTWEDGMAQAHRFLLDLI
jgi:glycosyltransferase involved in cell wall biosynthesis